MVLTTCTSGEPWYALCCIYNNMRALQLRLVRSVQTSMSSNFITYKYII
jgi:hypothetical protein